MQQQQRNWAERARRPVYKITIKTEEGIRDRIRYRDTATRDKQPNHHGPTGQRHGDKGYVRQRQSSEINTRPEELKSPPIPTRRDGQHWSTHHHRRQHDRPGDQPCYRRR